MLILFALLPPGRALAQLVDPNGPDPASIKLRLGPLLLNPTLALGNIGIDENVFNDARNPQRDFTMTISPKAEWWLPFKSTWFNGIASEDLVWFQKYSAERSTNHTLGINWKAPLTRMTVDLGARRTRTRERPGFEIDERAARTMKTYSGSLAVRVRPNTTIDVTARQEETDFDEKVLFNGVRLHDQLNRTVSSLGIGVSQNLTPFTTLSFGITRQHDRFAVDRVRDSNSTHATVAVRFDPQALLKGGAAVSYTGFTPRSDAIPRFRGLTLAADVTYSLLERTRFTLRSQRGLEYSFEATQPYYLQTSYSVEVAHQVVGPLDVVVRRGIAHLDYRNQAGVPVAVADRSDRASSYGAGFGYRVGQSVRFGFYADRYRRDSVIESRRYSRPVYSGSVTYDF